MTRRIAFAPCSCPAWFAVAVLTGSVAHAQPEPLAFDWSAPASCPQREAVLGLVAQHLGRSAEDVAQAPLSVDASVEQLDSGWVLSLAWSQGEAHERREISGASCSEVARAAALLVALAIDPNAVDPEGADLSNVTLRGNASDQDATEGRPSEPSSGVDAAQSEASNSQVLPAPEADMAGGELAAAPLDSQQAARVQSPPRPKPARPVAKPADGWPGEARDPGALATRPRWSALAGVGVSWGALPGPAPGIALGGQMRRGWFALDTVAHWFGVREVTNTVGAARFWETSLGLHPCFAIDADRAVLSPCLLGELAGVYGRGIGINDSEQHLAWTLRGGVGSMLACASRSGCRCSSRGGCSCRSLDRDSC